MKVTVSAALPPLSRVKPSERETLRVALVQFAWNSDSDAHKANLREGIKQASEAGAKIVFLPELTLTRYPADTRPTARPNSIAESLTDGSTFAFAKAAARDFGVYVHASLYEFQDFEDGRGLNTAIIVSPEGDLVAKTHKLHIPVTAGYYEDEYFQPGPAEGNPYPVYDLLGAKFGLPTCWDEWFPEVARSYSLRGAEVLCYPTAIGSEPDHPDFDTAPLWQKVIVGHAIANGTFMVVPNRWGNEGSINFYGSSFICDPYGRIITEASRDTDEVLVADLDLDQRRDWLDLFPFLATRRPDTYAKLTAPVQNPRQENGDGLAGGIAGVAL